MTPDTPPLCTVAGYQVFTLAQGFPGKSPANGGLGWSTVLLLRGHGRAVLVDTGAFSLRRLLLARLARLGLDRHDITDVLLTHAHYDHMMNWTLFPRAQVHVSGAELDWALTDPIETSLGAELYVGALATSDRLRRFAPGGPVIPGVLALDMPGHTPHHVIFQLDDADLRLVIAADAVKNRAELLSGVALSTLDQAASDRSIAAVRRIWQDRAPSILVCGHDLPLEHDGTGHRLLGDRQARITAWLGDSVATETDFPLTAPQHPPG